MMANVYANVFRKKKTFQQGKSRSFHSDGFIKVSVASKVKKSHDLFVCALNR